MTAWLVRHGRAAAPAGVAVGWTDVPLDRAGLGQARRLARELGARPVGRVFSSDLRRARETAEVIARGLELPVEATPDLREVDFGAWEGRPLGELWTEAPGEARAWESDLRRLPSAFGETFAALRARVLRFAAGLPRAGEVVVVGHRGSLAVLHAELAGIAFEAAWERPLAVGAILRVDLA